MSTLEEIDSAFNVLKKHASDFALLHCNSSYPAPLEELNLECIKTLKERYDCEVGYSGHEFRLGTSVAAIYLGATIIERHITLDRAMYGSDQSASVEPAGLKQLVGGVRKITDAMGDGKKTIIDAEIPIAEKLREHLK